MLKKFTLLAAAAMSFASVAHADTFAMGPETSTFIGNTRGYWFTAPTDFLITSLFVEGSSGQNQWAEVLRLAAAPPVFSTTTNDFVSLGYFADQAAVSPIATSIAVHAGDIIGILGSRGVASINSYGSTPYSPSIFGTPTPIARFGMQFDLSSGPAHDVWTEGGGSYSRVTFTYGTLSPAVPEPATWALMIGGFALVGAGMRRRASSVSFA